MKTAAMALVLFLLAAPGVTFSQAVGDATFKAATSNIPGAEYPQINAERHARFRVSAPQAEKVELNLEELEAVIAPGTHINHNETLEVELGVEELEEVIAPGVKVNHNEMVEAVLCTEELEEVIAPGIRANHNETVEVELNAEEVEAVIAPGLPLI